MAVATGTATNYLDLLDRFNTFVTATLPAGQRWTKLKDSVEGANDRNLYYVAPGLAGTDLIYSQAIGFKNVGNDYYNIGFRGMRGFNPGTPYDNQPNLSPGGYILLWNTAIPYWFVGNGRRVIVVAKVSGVYQSAYIGLLIPSASPSEWQYPMFVGGCHSQLNTRWSNIDPIHKAFWCPATSSAQSITPGNNSGAFLLNPAGEWISVGKYNTFAENQINTTGNLVWPYGTIWEQVGKCYDASAGYTPQPIALHGTTSGGNYWGEFDGVFFVSGFQNATENIITIGGVDYLVVQNTFRTSGPANNATYSNHYALIALQ